MLKALSSNENTLIIITHYFKILEFIDVDKVYVMKDGNIVKEGDSTLAKEISEN
jgi:Fe-S cluster assembly ATP-binding protein